MLKIEPGFPFTKQFVKIADGTNYPTVEFGPPEAGEVIHIKGIVGTYDNASMDNVWLAIELDVGIGYRYMYCSNANNAGGVGTVYGDPIIPIDFYLTENQRIRISMNDNADGHIGVITIFGEHCYISNMVEVGD